LRADTWKNCLRKLSDLIPLEIINIFSEQYFITGISPLLSQITSQFFRSRSRLQQSCSRVCRSGIWGTLKRPHPQKRERLQKAIIN